MRTMKEEIQPGDVALDKTQGRPVHIIEATGQTAAEWSDANDYELTENYGNERCDAADGDLVYDVVYCSNAKSEPSKSYAMPESRLLRIETEAADGGRPVYQRAVRDTLESLFRDLAGTDAESDLTTAATEAFGMELTDEAKELADVELTINGAGDD